ncbi:DUF3368 domain-containing protein [Leptospira sp. GIMC2001]|uniref:DUF3368 domain-containing protein n=1 Tax=Leptospira sp. GIMC2001 TaxID=1513297 RepID=UPI00234B9146|nr:DUF3368 domain-containing protein [Leptospira sp. GIMC2001]WCL50643.1 DUF3368 domain-containing protein [Leptospira sp. GIMC2001]
MILIPDSSPLISFSILDRLDLLEKVSDQVIIPYSVYSEVSKENRKYSKELDLWSKSRVVQCKNMNTFQAFRLSLGLGESECLVLAKEIFNSVLLINDKKARKIAKLENVKFVGTLGILISAKEKGYVDLIKPLIEKLEIERIHLSKELINKALFLAIEK